MSVFGQDSLKTRRRLKVGDRDYDYFSLKEAESQLGDISRLPFSLKVLLENLLRHEDGRSVTVEDVKAMGAWLGALSSNRPAMRSRFSSLTTSRKRANSSPPRRTKMSSARLFLLMKWAKRCIKPVKS